MPANGTAVKLGAVCVAVACFLPPDSYRDPVGGRTPNGHDETVKRYQVRAGEGNSANRPSYV
jgi:hypothetical protein